MVPQEEIKRITESNIPVYRKSELIRKILDNKNK